MFRRHWSGLPKEVFFPTDLKELGYFVNDDDEIRNIEAPDFYFKFFLDHNSRINHRQRFVFDHALEDIVHLRLEKLGLNKVRLPLGVKEDERHVPIMASSDIASKSHVILIIGEPCQELGVLAKRVASGRGGIDKGSMVSVVRALQRQPSSADDAAAPGILLANPGQLHWWPEGRRALTTVAKDAVPLPSLVHRGSRFVSGLHDVPLNEDPEAHVRYVCRQVVERLVRPDARISLVAIGQSCELLTQYLDDADNWAAWESRLNSMLLLGHLWSDDGLGNPALKDFLAKRTRAYLVSDLPLDLPLAPPAGNADEGIPKLGCPCYSSSEPFYTELILIRALESVCSYIQAAATTPGFENPPIVVTKRPPPDEVAEVDWEKIPQEEKPVVYVHEVTDD
ncbi:hypothetical protein CDD80_3683 [Ophiocordyceps camponoti-rufipedis]|uniref:Arb2 domain-containing protein n=1 Tax=Ophiocordyceps camponoti-rufipedis TaxID=2004952 RepID=A0A2C5ZJA6_9HYPO|nr:hypothetical protein CDD80_3683 [Ophiocordyceps camponoti-rufipedis]